MISGWRLAFAVVVATSAATSVGAADATAIENKPTRIDTFRTDQTALSTSELARAQVWGLSQTEWRRYGSLMQGIRGSVSPATISPIEVLGIHARDETERRRYAELWAQAMWEDAERILAFQRAYVEAGRKRSNGVPLIDLSRLPKYDDETLDLQPGDRVLFFTRPDCASCDVVLKRLLKRIEAIAGIDIYLAVSEAGREQAVRDWAATHGIAPDWVHRRKVTLNFEAGALAELTDGQAGFPTLMRRRGEDLALLSPGVL